MEWTLFGGESMAGPSLAVDKLLSFTASSSEYERSKQVGRYAMERWMLLDSTAEIKLIEAALHASSTTAGAAFDIVHEPISQRRLI